MTVPGPRGTDADALTIDIAIVGAQKCGTTTLAELLGAHPQLCLAKGKEAHLFDDEQVQRDGADASRLQTLFAHRQPGQLLLDATPSYLYLPGCIEALVRHNPAVKVIAVLRPACERVISHHRHERRRGVERLPLPLALLAEPLRLRSSAAPLQPESAQRTASYLDRCRYSTQLRRLHALVAQERVYVTTLDAVAGSTGAELSAIHRFLGIESLPIAGAPRLNASDQATGRVWPALLERMTRREMDAAAELLGWPPERLRSRSSAGSQ